MPGRLAGAGRICVRKQFRGAYGNIFTEIDDVAAVFGEVSLDIPRRCTAVWVSDVECPQNSSRAAHQRITFSKNRRASSVCGLVKTSAGAPDSAIFPAATIAT